MGFISKARWKERVLLHVNEWKKLRENVQYKMRKKTTKTILYDDKIQSGVRSECKVGPAHYSKRGVSGQCIVGGPGIGLPKVAKGVSIDEVDWLVVSDESPIEIGEQSEAQVPFEVLICLCSASFLAKLLPHPPR